MKNYPGAGAEPMTIKGWLKTSDYARPNRGIDYPDRGLLYNQLTLVLLEGEQLTLKTLIKCLQNLKRIHPELADEEVKVYRWRGHCSNIYNEVTSVNYMTNDLKCVIEVDEMDKTV